MIIDTHTHIFPAAIRDRREAYVKDEPAFALLYTAPDARLVGAAELVAAMDQDGVDKAVVFGFPWQDSETIRVHNDYIIEAVTRYPQRLIGFACVDPFNNHSATEVERCLAAGLAGIGELAFYEGGIDHEALKRLTPIMAAAESWQVPVLIHTNEPVGHHYPGKTANTLAQIYALVKAYPKNILILAHWGGGLFFYNLLKKEVPAAFENVYLDTAASPFLYQPQIYRLAAQLVGVEKILFGSDFPLLPPRRYFDEIKASGLNQMEIRQVCGLNAKKILSL